MAGDMKVYALKIFYQGFGGDAELAGIFYSYEAAEYSVKNDFPVGYIREGDGYEIEEFIVGEVKQ